MRGIWAKAIWLYSALVFALVGLNSTDALAQKSRRSLKSDETLSVQGSSSAGGQTSTATANSNIATGSSSMGSLGGSAGKVLVAPAAQPAAAITDGTQTSSESSDSQAMLQGLLSALAGGNQNSNTRVNADGSTTTTTTKDNGNGTQTVTETTTHKDGRKSIVERTSQIPKSKTATSNPESQSLGTNHTSSVVNDTTPVDMKTDTSKNCQKPQNASFVQPPLKTTYEITSCFGKRMHPILNIMKDHEGIDYAPRPLGSEIQVTAIMPGKVVVAEKISDAAGCTVVIEHDSCPSEMGPPPCQSRYLHLNFEDPVAKTCPGASLIGQTVDTCTRLGNIGGAKYKLTGRSTGAHLHLEMVTKAGAKVNPAEKAPALFTDKNKQGGTCPVNPKYQHDNDNNELKSKGVEV